jgi:DNA polymerase-1
MAFLAPPKKRSKQASLTPEEMMAAGCEGCPLQAAPKATPSGADPCDVYILGEAPGQREADVGEPFVGPSGRLLKSMIPAVWKPTVRFNNVTMSWPPKDNNGKQMPPTPTAMWHCHGYLIEDIEKSKPRAIFGFGATALLAMTGQRGIKALAGRHMPITVGSHVCWYFPFVHPASILHAREKDQDGLKAALRRQIAASFALVDTLPAPRVEGTDEAQAGVRTLLDAEQAIEWLHRASSLDRVGIDYETTGLSPYATGARLLSVAFATAEEAVAFPLDHRASPWTENERSAIYGALRAVLEAPVLKVAHNASFEMLWSLSRFGKRAARHRLWADTLAQAFLLDGQPGAHSLDHLCQEHFGLALKSVSDLDVTNLDNEPLHEVLIYNGMDAKYCLRLFEQQRQAIVDEGLQRVYDHHMARVAALVRVQHAGLPVDPTVNATLAASYHAQLKSIGRKLAQLPEVQAFEADGKEFNPAAPRHVAKILGIDTSKPFTTNVTALTALHSHPAKLVLKRRGLAKMLSTYIEPFGPGGGLVHGGKIHPVIGTTGTVTWRTNSQSPNIQNFPKRAERHRAIRSQIVAPSGCSMLCVDYSSIQARNVAMESRDPTLVRYFIDHYDMHQDWSERIQRRIPGWAKKRDQKTLRNCAKNELVFPLFFGAQPASVAGYLGVQVKHGYKLYDEFWHEFPEIRVWHHKLHRFYDRHHYVTGLSGFRRHAPITDNELAAAPIQADEVFLVCEALIRLSQYEDDALQPVMMIHDDLSFIIPNQRLNECVDIILHEMLRCEHLWLNVPLAVEVSIGQDWCNLSKVGQFESMGDGGYIQI